MDIAIEIEEVYYSVKYSVKYDEIQILKLNISVKIHNRLKSSERMFVIDTSHGKIHIVKW